MARLFKKRNIALFLAAVTALCFLLPKTLPLDAAAQEYENTYVNTGNQRKDIIGVALTQLGYAEGANNDSKYGTWFGTANLDWCGAFVTWCARQAEVSEDILARCAIADPNPGYYNIPYYTSDVYTPQPGDLFFTKHYSHVGLVYYVEGEYFYTLEGNTNDVEEEDSGFVMSHKRELKDYYFGVPAYEGCDKDHTYVRGQDQGHPHKIYYKCSTCGDKYYNGFTALVDGCGSCVPCRCSADYAGSYVCAVQDGYLKIRGGHSEEYYSHGGVPKGATVQVIAADPESGWAYIEFEKIRGHVSLQGLQKVKCSVNYDACGGTGAPKSHMQEAGQSVTIDAAVPVREGYTFLGWTAQKDGKFAQYKPGNQLTVNMDTTFYAVWKENSATAAALQVDRKPGKTTYQLGEAINTDGMKLRLTYSDGTAHLVTEGFEISGFDSSTAGKKTVTVTCQGASATYMVEILGDIPGDIDRNREVNRDDVMQLLWHISFPDQFPIQTKADFNSDEKIDRDDVMRLLWHISFPDKFPLTTE